MKGPVSDTPGVNCKRYAIALAKRQHFSQKSFWLYERVAWFGIFYLYCSILSSSVGRMGVVNYMRGN